jgi:membrane associated rhomboid family serine protease
MKLLKALGLGFLYTLLFLVMMFIIGLATYFVARLDYGPFYITFVILFLGISVEIYGVMNS